MHCVTKGKTHQLVTLSPVKLWWSQTVITTNTVCTVHWCKHVKHKPQYTNTGTSLRHAANADTKPERRKEGMKEWNVLFNDAWTKEGMKEGNVLFNDAWTKEGMKEGWFI